MNRLAAETSPTRMGPVLRLPTVSVAIALTLLAPALAQAKPPRPKSEQLSSVSQYRESLPSAAE